ncbi:hypothetical protein HDU83_003263 [Entophlyctis luteolus]|nr:hypothetical protein HDU83_003263 [Entophlyctis luteolus]
MSRYISLTGASDMPPSEAKLPPSLQQSGGSIDLLLSAAAAESCPHQQFRTHRSRYAHIRSTSVRLHPYSSHNQDHSGGVFGSFVDFNDVQTNPFPERQQLERNIPDETVMGESLAASPVAGDANDPILAEIDSSTKVDTSSSNPNGPSLSITESTIVHETLGHAERSEALQESADLAAFAAWVTLKLVGRRHSILTESKIMTSTSHNRISQPGFLSDNCCGSVNWESNIRSHSFGIPATAASMHTPIPNTHSGQLKRSFSVSIEKQNQQRKVYGSNFSPDKGNFEPSFYFPQQDSQSNSIQSVPSLRVSSSVGSASSIHVEGHPNSPGVRLQLPPITRLLSHFVQTPTNASLLPPPSVHNFGSAAGQPLYSTAPHGQPPPRVTTPGAALPTAYVAHYTSRLTRLASLTLLRLPTPPHTVLVALHLLRRVMSAPRTLPESLATPTRLLLACLVLADATIGSERGVPTRAWASVARSCGIHGNDSDPSATRHGAADPVSGGDTVCRLVVTLKREAVECLEYNLLESLVGYREWVETLINLLKADNSGDGLGSRSLSTAKTSGAAGMKLRTRLILEELRVGDGKLAMGWKW